MNQTVLNGYKKLDNNALEQVNGGISPWGIGSYLAGAILGKGGADAAKLRIKNRRYF